MVDTPSSSCTGGPDRSKRVEIERRGEERGARRVDNVACRDIAGIKPIVDDRDVVSRAEHEYVDTKPALTFVHGHKHRATAGQHRRRVMVDLRVVPIDSAQGLWHATVGVDLMQPCICDPNTMFPSVVHEPPRNDSTLQMVTGDAVPSRRVRFKTPSDQKATDCPSGEKNGLAACSVPGSVTVAIWSIRRT